MALGLLQELGQFIITNKSTGSPERKLIFWIWPKTYRETIDWQSINDFWSNRTTDRQLKILKQAGLAVIEGIDLCQDYDGFFYSGENFGELAEEFAKTLGEENIFQNQFKFQVNYKKTDRGYWNFYVKKLPNLEGF